MDMFIHEFHQFTEPIAVQSTVIRGQLFWEWTDKQLIRSVFLPYVLAGSLLKLIKFLHGNTIICSYLVLVLPRLVFTIMSLSVDCVILHTCQVAKITKVKEVLIVFATSYLAIVHLCHTLTNSIECLLFALLLFILFHCIKSRKENNTKQIALILTLGIWNRPTFILYALYPIYYWATIENHTSRKTLSNLRIVVVRLLKLLSFVKLFSIGLILIDTVFYQNDYVFSLIASRSLANFSLRRLVITPLNFIQFNIKTENLKTFGLNPLYLHLVVNFQLLFAFLGLSWIRDIAIFLRNVLDKKQRNLHFKSNFRTVLALSILPPLAILSLIPHQEPRFLLPLVFPLVILYGSRCYGNRTLFSIWIIFNVLLTGFYGFIHQAGVTRSLFAIKPELSKTNAQNVNIIYSSTYLPPLHLLGLHADNQSKFSAKINFHDLSVANFPEELMKTLNTIKSASRSSRHQTYLVAPSTLDNQLTKLARTLSLDFKLFRQLFPTFDFENFRLPASLSLAELRSKFSTNVWLIN